MPRQPITTTVDELWPRDAEHRFRIYAVVGDERTVLAATGTAGGIGEALVTLNEDQHAIGRRLVDLGRIAVLDVLPTDRKYRATGEWIVSPYDRRPA